MIAIGKLRGLIAERGLTQRSVAQSIGMTEKTFYNKMKAGKFDSDEMSDLIVLLDIKNPLEIFFAELGA